MKALFIEPPVDYPNTIINLGSNLGIFTLMSHVRKDCQIESDFYSFEYSKLLDDKMNIDQVLEYYNPDVLCISVMTHSFPFSNKLSHKAKEKGCTVIWGGIFVSQNLAKILKYKNYADYYICGEGEFVLPQLINNIKYNEHKNYLPLNKFFYSEEERKVYRCELPDFSFIPKELIEDYNLKATIETTRGCKYKCKFCSLNRLDYKMKSKDELDFSKELKNITKYKFKKAIICDSNFILDDQKYIKTKQLKEKYCPNLKFRITNRVDLLNKHRLQQFKDLGVDELIIGAEHIDTSILSGMKKTKKDVDNWKKLVKKNVIDAADMGILVHPIFMFGWPGETKKTVKKNKDFACELGKHENVEPFISFITPHPGNLTEQFVKEGSVKLITSDLSKYIHLYPVAIPISLGDDAIKYLVEAHNEIRITSKMIKRNPCFDISFVEQYSDLI